MLAPWKKSYDQPRQHIRKQTKVCFADKGLSSQSYGFSSSHVWMWELDHKESWAPKNLWFQAVVLEKTLESPLDCKEIKPVHPKGDQSWIFIEKTDAEAERLILWLPDARSQLIGKDPDAGKDWGQKEKGWQKMKWLDNITNSMDMNLSKLWDIVEDRGAWHATILGVRTQLDDWTIINNINLLYSIITLSLKNSYQWCICFLSPFCTWDPENAVTLIVNNGTETDDGSQPSNNSWMQYVICIS